MGMHHTVKVLVGRTTLFEAESPERLVSDIRKEAAFWASIFPEGVRHRHSDKLLRPNYVAVADLTNEHPFEAGNLDLFGRAGLAVFPVASSLEGRALRHYARTDLAFAILQYLWSESGWLPGREALDPSDEVTKGIGEMLVTAVRIGGPLR